MKKVGVVYFSHTDITGQLVDAFCSELQNKNIDILVYKINGNEIIEGRFSNAKLLENLESCQAIIFASPTYMGGVAAQFKAFADATSDLWDTQKLSNKFAAGITSGCSPNGDQTETIRYFQTLAAQHGMIWVGIDAAAGFNSKGINRLGCQSGVIATSSDGYPDLMDIETAKYLAIRICKLIL